MAKPGQPLFLARASYRRRRIADAARLVPFFGGVLLLLPGLWTSAAGSMIYIFTVWAVLILAIWVLSGRLRRIIEADAEAADPGRDQARER